MLPAAADVADVVLWIPMLLQSVTMLLLLIWLPLCLVAADADLYYVVIEIARCMVLLSVGRPKRGVVDQRGARSKREASKSQKVWFY